MNMRDLINIIEAVAPTEINYSDIDQFDMPTLKAYRTVKKDHPQPGESSGHFSLGRELNPFEYQKSDFIPVRSSDNAQWAYFEQIFKINGENPYLPVVYKADVERSKSGQERPRYQMEKLKSYKELTPEMIYSVYKIMFMQVTEQRNDRADHRFIKNLLEQLQQDPDNERVQYNLKYKCMLKILNFIEDLIFSRRTAKDKNLEQATTLIWNIVESDPSQFYVDLYMRGITPKFDNVMFRSLGKFGYQLVITDPIYNRTQVQAVA